MDQFFGVGSNELLCFLINDDPEDQESFDQLPEWVQDIINNSQEVSKKGDEV